MIIRVVENPMNHYKRHLRYVGCADEFSRQSKNADVWAAIDSLKTSSRAFETVRSNGEILYYIEKVRS